jgi:hypothetical protein
MELVVDVMADERKPGGDILGLEIYADGADRRFYAKSAQKYRDTMHLTQRVPQRVRVVWRKSAKGSQIRWGSASYYDERGKAKQNYLPPDTRQFSAADEIAKRKVVATTTGVVHHGPWGSDYGDEVLGDFDIPVGERIPIEVTDSLRKDGGELRIKFRVAADAVYFGWDVVRQQRLKFADGTTGFDNPQYFHSGGDFQEARLIYQPDGKITRGKGWYIDKKTGRRVETDF